MSGKTADPFKETVEVTLPACQLNEANFKFVGVNGRFYQVPRGKTVSVPRPVYDVLMSCQRAEEDAELFIRENLKA